MSGHNLNTQGSNSPWTRPWKPLEGWPLCHRSSSSGGGGGGVRPCCVKTAPVLGTYGLAVCARFEPWPDVWNRTMRRRKAARDALARRGSQSRSPHGGRGAVHRLGTHHLRSRQAASSSPRHRLSHGVVVWLVGCRNTRAARGTRRWSPDPWLLDLAGARWKYGIQN